MVLPFSRMLRSCGHARWPRALSTHASTRPILVRDFIRDSLYAPDGGYFVGRDVIYAPPHYIDFSNLLGHWEYRQVLSRLYAASEHAWLTPVLVFQPWYSYAIARWLVRGTMALRTRGGKHAAAPLVVYEVGGGTGANARHICDYVRAHAPQLYRSLQYTILEISPSLHARQAAALAGHAGVARSVVADATALSASGGVRDDRHCFVVACEVLDNLPHDKAVRVAAADPREPGTAGDPLNDGPTWRQVVVHVEGQLLQGGAGSGGTAPLAYSEALQPLTDPVIRTTLPYVLGSPESPALPTPPLLQRLTALARVAFGRTPTRATPHDGRPLAPGVVEARYVPTGSLQLLRSLQAAFPRHALWLADFDALPAPVLDLERAEKQDVAVASYYPAPVCSPLVASKGGASRGTVDHPTYLSPQRGIADIFFPTDFAALQAMVGDVRMAAHGPWMAAATSASGIPALASSSRSAGGAPLPAAAHTASSNKNGSGSTTSSAIAPGAANNGAGHTGIRVMSTASFMRAFADLERTRTLTGFNPLLQDYANTRVLVADLPP